jgi:hypothetical protein
MSKPVILLDAGQLVGLFGTADGDVLRWNATTSAWEAAAVGGTGTVTSVTAGAGLEGGTITGAGTISMPNVGTAGEYGSASSVAVITTDTQGRVSAATTTAISITQSQVADLVTDLALKADKSVTATAGAGLTGGGTLGANFSFALDTVGTAQTSLGSASKTVTISTDAYGRVTSLSEQHISGLAASVIASGQIGLAQGGTGLDASGVTAGQVLVGGSGSFALQNISGDATLASSGAMAVTKLQGNPVSATALGTPDAGKALIWSGSEWQASTIQGGGGGGGLTFFMNYAASSPYPMSPQFDENAGWDTGAITVANDANGTALGTFVTAVGTPAIEVIPAGLWDVNFYAQSSDGVNSTAVRVKIATLAGATQTVIATSDWVYLSDPSAVVGYSASVYVPLTDVALTDRVEIIFEGRRFVSPAQTVTLHFGTDSITHAHTTINAPGGTGLVKVVDGFLQSPATLLVNADVDAAAAIAVAKLAAGTDTYVLTTVSGVPTWSAPAATGVSSLTGTADQVLVGGTTGSPQTGALTLTLPQSIASSSSPTFAGLTVSGLSNGLVRSTSGVLSGGGSVSLTSEVTGTLPIGSGGTNLTSSGASGNLLVSDGSALASVAMSGDATLASTGALTLKNTGSAGTYGSASAVPVFVTDAQGRVTSVTNTSISIDAGQVTGLSSYAVTSLTGTANQVTVSASTGGVTLSLPSTLNPTAASTATAFTLQGGAGSGAGSAGAALNLYGGAGATGVGTTNGGPVYVRGGAAQSGGNNGSVYIGDANTDGVQLGRTGIAVQVAGTLLLNTALAATSGGTGQASYAVGDLLYADTTTSLAKLADVTTGNALISGGVSTAPSWGKIGLTTHVSGTLPLASGGTNANLTAANGQVAYSTASAIALTTGGSTGQFLSYNSGSAPTWASVPATPYDVSGEFVGSPPAGTTILRFVADRAFTFGGTAYFACTSNTGASTATFTVNVAGVSKGTVTIAGNATSGTGSITSTSVTAGQTVTVVATTPANVVDVWFTLPGTV